MDLAEVPNVAVYVVDRLQWLAAPTWLIVAAPTAVATTLLAAGVAGGVTYAGHQRTVPSKLTDATPDTSEVTTSSAEPSPDVPAQTEEPAQTAATGSGELMEAGFGQDDFEIKAVALVKNTSNQVGQFVTVHFNVLDATGAIIASGKQVEQFSRPGQVIPIVADIFDVPDGAKAAKIEPTLLVDPQGENKEPFPLIPVGQVKLVGNDSGTGWYGRVEVSNPTAEPIDSARVFAICHDAAGKVIGGGSDFPLVPPSGKALSELDLTVSGTPASCTAYASPS